MSASSSETCRLLEELAAELWGAASLGRAEIQRERELESVRLRAAIRLVPRPKLGFEDVHHRTVEGLRALDPETA